ncbi:putative bifunctional diguanylate cyclase/phosphodiesterase [Marinobacter orientalis]|uniref:cyclic-guanylate-specific phosphodiesterase n=1 Tax=Marinobacter orientalis TaxID=1928859 RepID=A0A7Y0NLD2_9GAMM|nr:EAL domain-containing protein [Marinobacter orientalis]NMT62618.1 bifunctional diguanylate cyclase/phosphodiesterase [Marinobacter orientalis]TGX51309.1 bifunctional diguanylate cyclase/phosphodiesterase [Marinobacter orientalis]
MDKPASALSLFVRGLLNPVFPALILLVFLGIALVLQYGIERQDNAQIQSNLDNEALSMAKRLEREFLVHAAAIRRMAKRQEAAPDLSREVWAQDAQNYLADFGVYQAIGWIDENFIIRWIKPYQGNEEAIGNSVAFSPERRQALETARATGNLDISGVIDLKQGGKGLVIYAPILSGVTDNGFIAGVFRMETLARELFSRRALESFRIDILDDGSPTYALNPSVATDPSFSSSVRVELPTLDWTLKVTPSVSWVGDQRNNWPLVTFVVMLCMGLLVSLTTLLVQQILKRNQVLLKTRRELDAEIGQRQAVQQDLVRLETTDTLTGLANRRFFMEDLAHTMSIADRQLRQLALVMIDLDRFQMLNDSLGHQFGDELLIRVSERLNALSDERIMVAYSGGDEFMIRQQHVEDIDDIINLLGQIKHCFEAPFNVQGEKHGITATMGVAVYPQSGLDADTLMRNADVALYRAKEQGRNTYQFYTEGMQNREVMRLELDKDLDNALAEEEFVLYFQPQLDLNDSSINSVEALIRWQHPRRGLLPPVDFIPLAEESGRITDIGRWVVMAACRQLAKWQNSPFSNLRIAVNLSGRELDDESIVDHIQNTLESHGVPADRLEVELTEEIFIQNIEHNLNQLSKLHKLGVHLAIDDFGVGYSSLGYLRDFPVDLLKIDRSFITDVTERHDNAVITRAVINLAHNLGIQVVAEGVETREQLNFLKDHRCDLIQGYLISRPIPADELEKALGAGLLNLDTPVGS